MKFLTDVIAKLFNKKNNTQIVYRLSENKENIFSKDKFARIFIKVENKK